MYKHSLHSYDNMCVYINNRRFLQLQKRPRPSHTDETKNALVQSFGCSSFHLCCCLWTLVSAEAPCTGVGSYKAPGWWWMTQAVMVTGPSAHMGVMKLIPQNRIYPFDTISAFGAILPRNTASHKMASQYVTCSPSRWNEYMTEMSRWHIARLRLILIQRYPAFRLHKRVLPLFASLFCNFL